MDEKVLDSNDDSDITCNGGYPPLIASKCKGVIINRKDRYSVDSLQKLIINIPGYHVTSVEFPDCDDLQRNIDVVGQNWRIHVMPHGVKLHATNNGQSVEITSPKDFIKHGTERHHPDYDVEVQKGTLDIDNDGSYCMGCRFTVHYRPS